MELHILQIYGEKRFQIILISQEPGVWTGCEDFHCFPHNIQGKGAKQNICVLKLHMLPFSPLEGLLGTGILVNWFQAASECWRWLARDMVRLS